MGVSDNFSDRKNWTLFILETCLLASTQIFCANQLLLKCAFSLEKCSYLSQLLQRARPITAIGRRICGRRLPASVSDSLKQRSSCLLLPKVTSLPLFNNNDDCLQRAVISQTRNKKPVSKLINCTCDQAQLLSTLV